jgi:radical SAM protein with 4Fe4S-binding SPASM domain
MNSEVVLGAFGKHFREEKAPREVMPCRVGLRNYIIRPDGEVQVCWMFPAIGDARAQSAEAIWKGEQARRVRAQTIACDRLCLFTCLSQKTLADKARMAVTLLTGARSKAAASTPAR